MNNKVDERRHYRFPMFDDNTPVKQVDDVVRVVLQEEYPMELTSEGVTYTTDQSASAQEGAAQQPAGSASSGDSYGSSFSDYELGKELEVNYDSQVVSKETEKTNSPLSQETKPVFKSGYEPIIQSRVNRKQRQPEHKKSWLKGKVTAEDESLNETATSVTKRFVPTYIPESRNRSFASMKKEEEMKQVILKRFTKETDTYLLMDNSEEQGVAVEESKVVIKDPLSFKRDTTDIPFTRRQFKQLSEAEKEEVTLPSETEGNPGAGTRPSRLDRGLKGILADESGKQGTTRYFE